MAPRTAARRAALPEQRGAGAACQSILDEGDVGIEAQDSKLKIQDSRFKTKIGDLKFEISEAKAGI
jgi:hypothetical protein